jgi:hypothetical protein
MVMRVIFAIGYLMHLSFGQEPEFIARCGDCWCVPEGGTVAGTCPGYPDAGIWQSFPDEWPQQLKTFELTSEPLTLQTATGEKDCYLFFRFRWIPKIFQIQVSTVSASPVSQ